MLTGTQVGTPFGCLRLLPVGFETSRTVCAFYTEMASPCVTTGLILMCLVYGIHGTLSQSKTGPRNITENCPIACFCSKTLSSVNCEGKELTSLPVGIPSKVVNLYLSHNKIRTIPSMSFKGLTNLVKVDLSFNKIEQLPQNAFTGASALSTIDLTHNVIREIDTQAFELLLNLKILQLGNNKLTNVICLGYTQNLQQLILQGNALQTVYFPDDTEVLTNLNDITLSSNQINNISDMSFLALKNAKVRRLDLEKNLLTDISTKSFSPLTQLQSLRLGMNPTLQTSVLKAAFSGITSKTLASVDISGVGINGLDASLFLPFQNSTLRNLRLAKNTIPQLTDGNFRFVKQLYTLDISGCHLLKVSKYAFSDLHNLAQLNLNDNSLTAPPKYLPSHLTKLYLSNNMIVSLHKDDFGGLSSLQHLVLSSNKILTLETDAFSGLSDLLTLQLQGNKIATIPGQLFNPLQQLTRLDISDNHLQRIPKESDVFSTMISLQHFNMANNMCKEIPINLFTGMTELLTLNLQNNLLASVIEADTSGILFRGLGKLQTLVLNNNDVTALPDRLFQTLISLTQLQLQDNRISHWQDDMFVATSKLQNLNLGNNLVSTMNQTSLKDLLQLKNLNLSGNPFSCDCQLRWFRDWLNSTKVEVRGVDAYICNQPPSWQGKPLLSFSRKHIDCVDRTPYYIGSGVGAGIIITCLILVSMYRYRWFIKLRLNRAKKRMRRRNGNTEYERINGDDRQFDVYVSYADSEIGWILNHLLPVIDNGKIRDQQMGGQFKLCVHDRDFALGESIVESIDTCMRGSRKVLVVLSKDYLKDARCEFELKYAFDIVNVQQDIEEMVIIKKGRLRIKEIPKIISSKIEKREFVEWIDDDEEAKENFVEELSRRLRERIPPTNLEI